MRLIKPREAVLIVTVCIAMTTQVMAAEQTDCTIPPHTKHQLCRWGKLNDAGVYGTMIPEIQLAYITKPDYKQKISRVTLNETFYETIISPENKPAAVLSVISAQQIHNHDDYYRIYVDNNSDESVKLQITECVNYPTVKSDYNNSDNWDCGG